MTTLSLLRAPAHAHTRRMLVALALLVCTILLPQSATAAGLNVNWYRFGQQAMKDAPAAVRNGPEPDKARYLAAKVADEYARLGVRPNTSLAGRALSLAKYGKATVGACGDLTSSLEDAFQGGGFKADRLVKVFGEKPNSIMRLERGDLITPMHAGSALFNSLLDVNSDHGGLGVVIGGKVWVVDAWRHGLETGSFKGFDKSPERLIPLPAWGAKMVKDGYVSYTRIETAKGNPDPKSYKDINALAAATENTSRSEIGWSDPNAPLAPSKRVKSGSSGASDAAGGGYVPPPSSQPAPYQGIVLWPKLAGSSWAGQINARESNEDGSADFVYSLDIRIDSGNNISGGFEFPIAHTPQGPVRQRVPCAGRYDPGSGRFTLTFEKSHAWTDATTVKPVAMSVKVDGTLKGRVEADPNHQDLAQGEFRGSRALRAAMAGGNPITANSHLVGSWRLQRKD